MSQSPYSVYSIPEYDGGIFIHRPTIQLVANPPPCSPSYIISWVQTQCDILSTGNYEPIVEAFPLERLDWNDWHEFMRRGCPYRGQECSLGPTCGDPANWVGQSNMRHFSDSLHQNTYRQLEHRGRNLPRTARDRGLSNGYGIPVHIQRGHQTVEPNAKSPTPSAEDSSFTTQCRSQFFPTAIVHDFHSLHIKSESPSSLDNRNTNIRVTTTAAQDGYNLARELKLRQRLLSPINTDVANQLGEPKQVFMIAGSNLRYWGQEFIPGSQQHGSDGWQSYVDPSSDFDGWIRYFRY